MWKRILSFIHRLFKVRRPSKLGYRVPEIWDRPKPIVAYFCDGEECGDECPNEECFHTFDISHAANFEPVTNDKGVIIAYEEKEHPISWDDFLSSLENIAVGSGFRLCMERAPIGCGIMFYFRDAESGLRSADIWFHSNRENAEELFGRLATLAAEFRARLNENKESFETYDKIVDWENEINRL